MSEAQIIPLLPVEELERRRRREYSETPQLWKILDAVMDPEIPVISLYELGVLQNISIVDEIVYLVMTPTYIGCPAMNIMEEDARAALLAEGYDRVVLETQLAPAWTTAWLTPVARQKMAAYGVAAPEGDIARCPQCASTNISVISEFGSTACKALYRCQDCREPFDLFKAI